MAREKNPITVLGPDGRPLAGASVMTRLRATGADATVYAAETGNTPGSNPAITDARGRIVQYLDKGKYSSTVTAAGMDPYVEEWDAVPADDVGKTLIAFTRNGALAVLAGTTRFRVPVNCTILGVAATVGGAPTGASLIVDVNKNGTTLFTNQANRPTIAAGANASGDTVPDITALVAGDYLTIDTDQVGSTVAGSDLVVVVRLRQDA